MSEIELSSVVIDGLKSLNTVISLDLTKKIISNAVKMALHSDASKSEKSIMIRTLHCCMQWIVVDFYCHLIFIGFHFPSMFIHHRHSIESRNLCNKTNLRKASRIFDSNAYVSCHQIWLGQCKIERTTRTAWCIGCSTRRANRRLWKEPNIIAN